MAEYEILLSKKAQKQLDKLSDLVAAPIMKGISALIFNPRPPCFKKLKGREGYRIRIGSYRMIYEIIDQQLVIETITLGIGGTSIPEPCEPLPVKLNGTRQRSKVLFNRNFQHSGKIETLCN